MENTVLIGAILVFSSLIMGFSGFGFAIVAISFLSFFWSIKETVPFILTYNMAINLILLIQLRSYIKIKRVMLQIIGFMPGALLGVFFLTNMSDPVLKFGVGAILISFSLWSVLNNKASITAERKSWSCLAGFLSGILGGAVYMPGPPVIIYNTWTHNNKFIFKVNLQVFFLLTNLYLLSWYICLGLFTSRILIMNLYFSPLILVGIGLGIYVFRMIQDRTFDKFICGLLFIMGTLLLLKTAI